MGEGSRHLCGGRVWRMIFFPLDVSFLLKEQVVVSCMEEKLCFDGSFGNKCDIVIQCGGESCWI